MPEGLRDRIRAHAAENKRSMNSEIISLLEMGLWEADMSRMQSGMEPLREVTDRDRQLIELAKKDLERREARKDQPPKDDLKDTLNLILDKLDEIKTGKPRFG